MELDVTDEITKQIEKIVIRDEEGQVDKQTELSKKLDEKVLLKRKK